MPSPDYTDRLAALLAAMPHSNLMSLRDNSLPSAQPLLAPYEHRAFAREEVARNPLMAVPIGLAAPAYQAGKMLSPTNLGARTPPSLEELLQGYKGIWEGLSGKP